jgi:RNA polymerase sigma-70 factor (ECF subfamily)
VTDREAHLKALMLRGLDGDAAAWRSLLSEMGAHLRPFFRRRLFNGGEDAEDLVQETLIAIHAKRATWDRGQPFTAWAFAIARHKLVDALRRRGAGVPVDLDDVADTLPAPQTDPGRAMDLARALATLGRALDSFMRELGIENRPSVDTIQTAMHKAGLERATTDLRATASLSGERYDLSLRGSFTNLSFDNFTIGDMTAALCYGLVTSLRDGLPGEFLQARTEIVGSGNAICRSPLMQRVIRESFGCDLTLQEGSETTACGAALVAADAEA